MNQEVRQPHAHLGLPLRYLKGMKIERLLDLANRKQPLKMLEIGTGSGGIAHYFGTHPSLRCEVDAVDARDIRVTTSGYRFQCVEDTGLPYNDQAFDVVISNHVIEHVGDESAQRHHLAEIHRVLAADGIGYLAVPNRWALIEPHYRLAFLSWLPHGWRTPYLRLCNKGNVYDCEPLQLKQLERMLRGAGLEIRNMGVDALRAIFDIERPDSWERRLLQNIPSKVLKPFDPIIPTLIYRFSRSVK